VEVSWVATHGELQQALRQYPNVDVVLTDVTLPDGDWRAVLEAVNCQAEVIVYVPQPERAFYCEVIQNGAYDVLSEPEDSANLSRLLRAAASRHQMRRLSASLAQRKSAA
jgi:DNA-binding NtrC family response regulator